MDGRHSGAGRECLIIMDTADRGSGENGGSHAEKWDASKRACPIFLNVVWKQLGTVETKAKRAASNEG